MKVEARMRPPFHPDELEAQRLAGGGSQGSGIRDFMQAQHRAFFAALPYVVVAARDRGWPAATVLEGEPGFVSSPDPVTLRVEARLNRADPVAAALTRGAPAALLGIDLATRRRNRANGVVAAASAEGFVLSVRQSFGNCPPPPRPPKRSTASTTARGRPSPAPTRSSSRPARAWTRPRAAWTSPTAPAAKASCAWNARRSSSPTTAATATSTRSATSLRSRGPRCSSWTSRGATCCSSRARRRSSGTGRRFARTPARSASGACGWCAASGGAARWGCAGPPVPRAEVPVSRRPPGRQTDRTAPLRQQRRTGPAGTHPLALRLRIAGDRRNRECTAHRTPRFVLFLSDSAGLSQGGTMGYSEAVLDFREAGATGGAARPPSIIGTSTAMRRLLATVARVAPKDVTVLVRGETGTGKELIASLVHVQSSRSRGPLVRFNCAAIPGELAEAELFGHTQGAFTGATHARGGYSVQAAGGPLVLAEVGELPLPIQATLLRALQDGAIQPA